MLSLFRRKAAPPIPSSPTPASPAALVNGFTQPESAASLLATPRRQKLLAHIWQRTALSRAQFATLYQAPIDRYAELMQQFPASESHHHAYPGGMLDHGLEIVAYALKLRQSHLMPAEATPEEQAAQAEAWTAGVAYAALLHDLGKIAVDLDVEQADGHAWHPWHGPLQQPYRFRYRADRQYRLHGAATGLLFTRVLDRGILDWLSHYPSLWASLLYVLAGQYEHAGALGELTVKADQASVAQALGGDPAKAMAAPRNSLQRKLLEGLRHLLKTEFKLNQPQASDGWLTQDALWLVSKTVSDKLRAHLLSQGIEGIPASNTAVFNVLQEHGIVLATPDGKAIWKASVTSDAGWSHSFTFLKLSPASIWEAGERPAPFAGTVHVEQGQAEESPQAPTPAEPSRTRDEPQMAVPVVPGATTPALEDDGGSALLGLLGLMGESSSSSEDDGDKGHSQDTDDIDVDQAPTPGPTAPSSAPETPSGEHFMAWLVRGVQTRRIIINDARALVHTVAGTAYLVSPGLFRRYAQEHPQAAPLAKDAELDPWLWAQKQFEQLGLHQKHPDGLNIWTCDVTGPRKSRRLHGYLLTSSSFLFSDAPPDNPYLSLVPRTEDTY